VVWSRGVATGSCDGSTEAIFVIRQLEQIQDARDIQGCSQASTRAQKDDATGHTESLPDIQQRANAGTVHRLDVGHIKHDERLTSELTGGIVQRAEGLTECQVATQSKHGHVVKGCVREAEI